MSEVTEYKPEVHLDGLLPGEQVLWYAAPRPVAYLWRTLPAPTLLSAASLLVAALWEWQTVGLHHAAAWAWGGWLFALVGLYGVLVRPALAARAARRVVYVITDRRVVSARRTSDGCVEARWQLPWRPATALAGRRAKDLRFAGPPARRERWGMWNPAGDGDGFIAIDELPAAMAALGKLRAASGQAAGAWTKDVRTP